MISVTIIHNPGYGQRDHLFSEFAATLSQYLQGAYRSKTAARSDIHRYTTVARIASEFDGNFAYKLMETHAQTAALRG